MTELRMRRLMLKSKIHRALVTGADLLSNEQVHVLNLSNGARAENYVIRGRRNSGEIILNGAIARLVQVNDLVIILSYSWMTTDEAKRFQPIIVQLDNTNRLLQTAQQSFKTRRSH